ncbi:hypothetical protein ANCCAN_13780 [Ancylostoma caninum]|uniref:Uncharacterized protein n=1 Tax=Ancylostoma caninum TaxID=29170 RepID=A0A368G790_ANCCA|nr:hypothetical protein ANCCAN_13780 [Ancylostoma caninum]
MDYDPHAATMSTMYMGQQITHPAPMPMQPPPQQVQHQRNKSILTIQDPNTLEEVDLGARSDAAADAKKDDGKGRKDIDETEQKKSEVMRQFTRQLQERNEMDQAESTAAAASAPPLTKPNSVPTETPAAEEASSSKPAEEQKPAEKETTPEVSETPAKESTPEVKPAEVEPAPEQPAPAVESAAEPAVDVVEPAAEPQVPAAAEPEDSKPHAEEEEVKPSSAAATPEVPAEAEEESTKSDA